jgi:enoyl-CoA hydratase/carnithine racemase
MSLVQIKSHPPGGTIVLNRPDKRNALSRPLLEEIAQGLSDLHQEKKVRAVILTGAGSVFSGGMDLHEMHATSQSDDPQSQWFADAQQYRSVIEQMLRFPKPIIASVNGPALGGATGLVLAADIVIAAQSATFGIPATRRGLVAGMVAPLLTFRIGAGPAANLLLTGNTIDATEAARLNIFHELVEDDLVWARANDVAAEIGQASHEAITLTKRMLNETIGEQLSTLLAAGAAANATAKTTEAAVEGLAAFVERREPEWP